jgi:hypothetical protein
MESFTQCTTKTVNFLSGKFQSKENQGRSRVCVYVLNFGNILEMSCRVLFQSHIHFVFHSIFGWVSSGVTLTPLCFYLLFSFSLACVWCCSPTLRLKAKNILDFWCVFCGWRLCVVGFLYETFFFNKIWLGVVLVFGRCSCLIVIMHEAEYCQVFFTSPCPFFEYINKRLAADRPLPCVPE